MLVKTEKVTITKPGEIAAILTRINKAQCPVDRMKETFWVVGLSTRNSIQYVEMVSMGTLNASLVHPREVFRFAIMKAVSQIILGHNHPSGDPEPSDEDIRITQRLTDAGKVLGIEVIDHVIIGKKTYRSLKETGVI